MTGLPLQFVPLLTLILLAVPVAAGLVGTLAPALGLAGPDTAARAWAGLLAAPGVGRSLLLSLWTGAAASVLALILTLMAVAAGLGTGGFRLLTRLLAPLLALPHAAAALGLAFLIAPSGWIARVLSPWATGWTGPPDLLIPQDPAGLSLIFGLALKEMPFLMLMTLAALPQVGAERGLVMARALGHGRLTGFLLAVLPQLWPHLRLPVAAVLAYALTSVEMAMILGPVTPAPLAPRLVGWAADADPDLRGQAAAGAVLLALGVTGTLLVALLVERCAGAGLRRIAATGWRFRRDGLLRGLALGAALAAALMLGLGLVGLAVWSVAGPWPFPAALPEALSGRVWARSAFGLGGLAVTTLVIGLAATLAALVLTIACLEAETRFGLRPGARALALLYLPLLVPQVLFLPGLQVLASRLRLDGGLAAVIAVHVVFVLPYVFLSLADPWRGWDRRIGLAGASLRAGPGRVLWCLRLPMLLGPVLTAAAVGLAVSAGQYLPTLMLGGGRVATLTTEAVALASGGDRRVIGATALVQAVLPALGFAAALALPALLHRHRAGMRGGG